MNAISLACNVASDGEAVLDSAESIMGHIVAHMNLRCTLTHVVETPWSVSGFTWEMRNVKNAMANLNADALITDAQEKPKMQQSPLVIKS